MQTSIAEFKEDAWDPAGKQPHLDPVVRSAQVGPRMAQPPTASPPRSALGGCHRAALCATQHTDQ